MIQMSALSNLKRGTVFPLNYALSSKFTEMRHGKRGSPPCDSELVDVRFYTIRTVFTLLLDLASLR